MPRVVLVVMDSLGVGEMPDAGEWGDAGADTLGHIAERVELRIPNLAMLGLTSIRPLPDQTVLGDVDASYGKMAIAGAGKDTIAGHWELAGVRVQSRFDVYYQGFSAEQMAEWEAHTGYEHLGNEVASGTEIIARLGPEHLVTGKPIVYTSADSVFQIAAHEKVIPVSELYELCKDTFELVKGWGIARVIARPFVGTAGAFVRTENRHDYAQQPPRPTLMDVLQAKGIRTTSIGKVKSIFGDRGFDKQVNAGNNTSITEAILREVREGDEGLIFANLVDFDMLYGHRRDPEGYGRALMELDAHIPELLAALRDDDLLILTADHGNDPTFRGTDHTREYVPVIAYKKGGRGRSLGTRSTLADAGATAAAWLGCKLDEGTSFAELL